uniref:intermediate filament protein IF-B n=1 Tax=Ciona intestinalis TaxID=7719 RepID=UPI0000523D3A|nr:intermediate filament protein IF-B [Ciona intestinalis]|eukprot:XP_002119114.1 glial fibrillary acidic protein-like isoform X2 [Ciona intestinalis]
MDSSDYRYSGGAKAGTSSYQLRYGGNRFVGARRSYGGRSSGVIEAPITRVTVSDGLELTPSLMTSRSEEKAELGSLNDRFVSYIDKVRSLTAVNRTLEIKIKQLEANRVVPSRSGQLYEAQLHKLQRELEKAVVEKTRIEIELENCYRELDAIRLKLEREEEDRKFAEEESASLRKDVDQATLARTELETKVESLQEELDLVRRSTDEDIRVLTEQLSSTTVYSENVDEPTTDLSESLKDVRAAYERLTQKNKIEIEGYYKTKISDLQNQLKEEAGTNKSSKTEVLELRRQLQSVTNELESTANNNSAIETQLQELDIRYHNEVAGYQQKLMDMEAELSLTRDRVARQLVDYNELLNIKLSLDFEIKTYRKLLEGEENRINVSSSSVNYNGELSTEGDVISKVVTVEERKVVIRKESENDEKNSSSSSSSSSSESESEI